MGIAILAQTESKKFSGNNKTNFDEVNERIAKVEKYCVTFLNQKNGNMKHER